MMYLYTDYAVLWDKLLYTIVWRVRMQAPWGKSGRMPVNFKMMEMKNLARMHNIYCGSVSLNILSFHTSHLYAQPTCLIVLFLLLLFLVVGRI